MSRIALAAGRPTLAKTRRSWAEWVAWVATEDHCEWANPYVAWVKTPLGVLLVGAACSLLCGLFVAPQGYAVLGAITAVVAVGIVWPLVAIRGVRCRFVFESRRGREGQATAARLVVTNRWPWPLWGLAMNAPILAEHGEAPLALARVAGWSTATFNCPLVPTQRGVYPIRQVRLGTGFPFGLYQASRAAEVPRRLIVWPRTFALPPVGGLASHPHCRGAFDDDRAGSQGTRLGVRDHRNGDSLRDVHWAKTARYDRLIVSERESKASADVTIVVPTTPQTRRGSTSDPTLEWRVRIAASLCESFAMNLGRAELWIGEKRLSAGRSPGDLARLLDGLAEFDGADASDAGRLAGRKPPGDTIVIEANESSIVLRRYGGGEGARRRGSHRTDWIEIELCGDVPEQLLRGWRRSDSRRLATRRGTRAG